METTIKPREPMTTIVCGMTGVGKTFRTAQEIEAYLMDDPSVGRKGRKVLIFDVNGEDAYAKYDPIKPEDVKAFVRQGKIEARRLIRIDGKGNTMNLTEIQKMISQAVQDFRSGLFILEDIDKYMQFAKAQEITSMLTANRHQDLDVIIAHQSMAKITTTEWQNVTILRLHYQIDDPARYETRIPNAELVRLAKFVVDEQYLEADNEYYLAYIDIRRQKFYPCDEATFRRVCERYLYEETKELSKMMNRIGEGSRSTRNKDKAIDEFVRQKIRYIQ